MEHLIDKDTLVAEVDRWTKLLLNERNQEGASRIDKLSLGGRIAELQEIKAFLNTIEVKEVELIIHTIIAECCDWLASHTNLSRNEIEGCRNLMLTVKGEQLKAQKGE